MTEPQRVLIVDDHGVVRRGLRSMLTAEPWVVEVFEAENTADAIREAVREQVDLVVMDIHLPDGDGIEATRQILRRRPAVKVLVVSMSADEVFVSGAMDAGARGYLVKDADPDDVVNALKTVAGGGYVLGAAVGASHLQRGRSEERHLAPPLDRLTPRELKLAEQLAQGRSNAQIASQFNLSEKTIRNQLSGVFAKLGVADRVQAALLARERGLG